MQIEMKEGNYFMGYHRLRVAPFATRFGERVWMVYDAEWCTVADARNGHSAPVVAQFDRLEKALFYCSRVLSGELTTEPHASALEGWPELRERVGAYHLRHA